MLAAGAAQRAELRRSEFRGGLRDRGKSARADLSWPGGFATTSGARLRSSADVSRPDWRRSASSSRVTAGTSVRARSWRSMRVARPPPGSESAVACRRRPARPRGRRGCNGAAPRSGGAPRQRSEGRPVTSSSGRRSCRRGARLARARPPRRHAGRLAAQQIELPATAGSSESSSSTWRRATSMRAR